jgi:RNA-binding motif protein, X-linked 2
MNSIRQTQALNKLELQNAVPPSASWHADYRDTAYIYVGGLPFDVSEGDIVAIFSQYGTPTHVNLVRDKETGKSKGFAFLKYEDQRSCDLAVDNLGGAEVLGRVLRVDHTRYKKREGEDEEAYRVDRHEEELNGNGKRTSEDEEDGRRKKHKKRRPMIKEERELEELLKVREGEEEDPMREYLIKEKREKVEQALIRVEKKERKHKHRHRHHRDDEERTLRRRDGDAESEHRSHHHRERDRETEDRPRRRLSSVSDDDRSRTQERRSRGHEDRHRDNSRRERDHRD